VPADNLGGDDSAFTDDSTSWGDNGGGDQSDSAAVIGVDFAAASARTTGGPGTGPIPAALSAADALFGS